MSNKIYKTLSLLFILGFTLYLVITSSFNELILFWFLCIISYKVDLIFEQQRFQKDLVKTYESTYSTIRHLSRILLATSKQEPLKLVEAAEIVYEWDISVMTVDELREYYEILGQTTGAKIWFDENEVVTKISARNVVTKFLGMGNDPKVMDFIKSTKRN